ncbi:MAG: hypothetical protein ACREOI_28335 [bacterium]
MEQLNQQNQSLMAARLRHLFFYWIAPSLLLIATVFTTLLMGSSATKDAGAPGAISLWKGLPFSFAILFIIGSHAVGHYM